MILNKIFKEWIQIVEERKVIELLKRAECNTFTAVPDSVQSVDDFQIWCAHQRKQRNIK